jgi:hypothetical protein
MNTEHIYWWIECPRFGERYLGTRAMHEEGTFVASAGTDGQWVLFDHTDLDDPTVVTSGVCRTQEEAVRAATMFARAHGLTVDL